MTDNFTSTNIEGSGYRTNMKLQNTVERYPWVCSLQEHLPGTSSSQHLCAVTILAVPPRPTVVVGAAHCTFTCTDSLRRPQPMCCCLPSGEKACGKDVKCARGASWTGRLESEMKLVCGQWQLGKEAKRSITLKVKEVVRHPDYSTSMGPGSGNDIAIFKLDDEQLKDYGGTRKVYPACLPRGGGLQGSTGIHAGWSNPPPKAFLQKYAPPFFAYYEDFSKQWHYKMDLQEKCEDPRVSPIFGAKIQNVSNSFFPGGLICAKDFTRQSCFSKGASGSPLMTLKDGKMYAEGILSFVKGCDVFTIGSLNDAWQMTRFSENPSAYVQLTCYLPWIAEQYGLQYEGPRECSPENGEKKTKNKCTETKSNLFGREKECIFPFFYEGMKYNECVQFDEEGYQMPVFRCPVRPIVTKTEGVNTYSSLSSTEGYCLNLDNGELDPDMECPPYQKVAPFSQCKNHCPGGKSSLLSSNSFFSVRHGPCIQLTGKFVFHS